MIKQDVVVAVASESKPSTEKRNRVAIKLILFKEFSEILKIKYNGNEDEMNKQEEHELERIFHLGLQEWQKEETGYEIIHEGKPADKRVLKKLGMIVKEILNLHAYPMVDGTAIPQIIKKALGNIDSRTMKDYRKTVLYYCNVDEDIIDRSRDSRLGELNVSGLVKRVPRSYVK
jgi:hypothetical protein